MPIRGNVDTRLRKVDEGEYDAIVLTTGSRAPRDLPVPGRAELDGIHPAMDYLYGRNRWVADNAYEAPITAEGKHVVVIGGGDTAMDCVRTAVRQGAASVTCMYRRDRANMPGSAREVANAEEEGVVFEWLAGPTAFTADSEGHVRQVQAARMRLGLPDASGRRAPEPDPGQEFTLPADLVIEALGFDPEDLQSAFQAPDLAVTRWGTVRAENQRLSTSIPGVFAAGDIVRGASLVVWAIREGRDVAAAMHAWLKSEAAQQGAAAPLSGAVETGRSAERELA